MNVAVDTNVTFTLSGENRKVTVDALELDDFVQSLWAKGSETAKLDADGKPVMRDGETVKVREVPWATVDEEFGNWLKAQMNGSDVKLKRSEIRSIWENSGGIWARKNERWHARERESESPTSQPSSDARYSESE